MSRPFPEIYEQTLAHLRQHDCGTYPFSDGQGLVARVRALAPVRILELGTALGYTACCFASAAPRARIDTLEMDAQHIEIAHQNIARHGFAERVTVHEGKFEETIPNLRGLYNLIFFDGFAPDLLLLTIIGQRLCIGGTLICANLGLAETAARQQIQREIQNTSRWKIQPSLENGGTYVVVKCAV